MSLVLSALSGKSQKKIPFWFMRQAGRYLPEYRELRAKAGNFLTLCYTPQLATEITLQPIRRFDMDAAIIFSDILVVPHALGLSLNFVEKEGPKLQTVSSLADIEKLSLTGFLDKLSPVFEALTMVRRELSPEKALIGFAGSPWTIACYMVDGSSHDEFDKARRLAASDPEIFAQLIALIVSATVVYLKEQIRSGAQVIQLFDSWSGLVDQNGFSRWVVEPTQQIVEQLKQEFPDIPVIGFPRQCGVGLVEYINQTGVDAVSLDYSYHTQWVAQNVQTKICVQGNLDPFLLNAGGEPMRRAARRILNDLAGGPFIFNLGHGVMQTTPISHVEQLCELVRSYE